MPPSVSWAFYVCSCALPLPHLVARQPYYNEGTRTEKKGKGCHWATKPTLHMLRCSERHHRPPPTSPCYSSILELEGTRPPGCQLATKKLGTEPCLAVIQVSLPDSSTKPLIPQAPLPPASGTRFTRKSVDSLQSGSNGYDPLHVASLAYLEVHGTY